MSFSAIETGKRIKQFRKAQKMSQFDLGQDIYISRNYVSKLENGRRVAKIEIYISLAEHFGVSLDELLLGRKQVEGVNESH